jgi:hypothetical protein
MRHDFGQKRGFWLNGLATESIVNPCWVASHWRFLYIPRNLKNEGDIHNVSISRTDVHIDRKLG